MCIALWINSNKSVLITVLQGYVTDLKQTFADQIPANAIVLATTASNWGLTNCGPFSVYTDTTQKSIQIMAPKSGNVGALYIDVLYIEKV